MLRSIIALSLLSLSLSGFAADLRPCFSKDMKSLLDSVNNAKADGLTDFMNLRNAKGEVVGYYAWNSNDEARAEVCESFASTSSDVVTASDWHYWENRTSSNPAKWTAGQVLRMTQDEGALDIRVLKASKTGEVSIEASVLGLGVRNFVVVRRQALKLTK